MKQTLKHGGGSVMVWGCMTFFGLGELQRINGIMDQYMYRSILEDKLLKTVENMPFEVNEVIFQQDRDPKHTAKSVKKWLETQQFTLLEWPAQSPDLNPIENLWSYLKSHIYNSYDSPASSLDILWERIDEQWQKIQPDYFETLANSMPRRIKEVMNAKGLWTKY